MTDFGRYTVKTLTHDEWLSNRRKYIGGSEISVLMGKSNWKSPLQLAKEKLQGSTFIDNDATKWGHLLEPLILEQARDELRVTHKKKIRSLLPKEILVIVNEELGTLATPDDLIQVPNTEDIIVMEAKSTRNDPADNITNWKLQVQWYMWHIKTLNVEQKAFDDFKNLTGYKEPKIKNVFGRIYCLEKGNIWHTIPVSYPDNETLDIFKQKALEFKEVLTTEDYSRYLPTLFDNQLTVTIPAEILQERGLLASDIDTLTKRKKDIDVKVKSLLGSNHYGESDDGNWTVKLTDYSSTTLDTSAIKINEPSLYDKYTKTSSHQRLYVKELK